MKWADVCLIYYFLLFMFILKTLLVAVILSSETFLSLILRDLDPGYHATWNFRSAWNADLSSGRLEFHFTLFHLNTTRALTRCQIEFQVGVSSNRSETSNVKAVLDLGISWMQGHREVILVAQPLQNQTILTIFFSFNPKDNPELFAMMEKTRMYVFRSLDPEVRIKYIILCAYLFIKESFV